MILFYTCVQRHACARANIELLLLVLPGQSFVAIYGKFDVISFVCIPALMCMMQKSSYLKQGWRLRYAGYFNLPV